MSHIVNALRVFKQNRVLFVGVLLLLLSAYPIFLIAKEIKAINDADARYNVVAYGWQSTGDPSLDFKVKCVGNRTFVDFYGQRVLLSDEFKMSRSPDDYDSDSFDKTKLGIVHISINGRDYTHSSLVEIRTEVDDTNRYWMQVMVAEITDKMENKTQLAILQSFPRFDFNNIANFKSQ